MQIMLYAVLWCISKIAVLCYFVSYYCLILNAIVISNILSKHYCVRKGIISSLIAQNEVIIFYLERLLLAFLLPPFLSLIFTSYYIFLHRVFSPSTQKIRRNFVDTVMKNILCFPSI